MINKYLYPKGGAESYMIRLGKALQRQGHQVEYFGMDSSRRTLGNRVNAYTKELDFHSRNPFHRAACGMRSISSREAQKKLRLVLEDFQPDVCHVNNFQYHLTPSILVEIRRWSRETAHPCAIVHTAHDFQLLCPNHMCRDFLSGELCEKCLNGTFRSCTQGRCIHGSWLKSMVGSLEAWYWNRSGIYQELDKIICCSRFQEERLRRNPILAQRIQVLPNFVEKREAPGEKKDYVLYFGRYSYEKGLLTLALAAEGLPEIPFVFAGAGPLEPLLSRVPNIHNVGFQEGEALQKLIREAQVSVCPSETYENCPFSVLESLALGTPVLGTRVGGIPEWIQDGVNGELFGSGNGIQLMGKLKSLWSDPEKRKQYQENCQKTPLLTTEEYVEELEQIYAQSLKRQTASDLPG